MSYDVVIRGGAVYDGTGSGPVQTDLAIAGDTIAHIGPLGDEDRDKEAKQRGSAHGADSMWRMKNTTTTQNSPDFVIKWGGTFCPAARQRGGRP